MRILLFSGKGGVGKTSLAAATGARLAELGYRTLDEWETPRLCRGGSRSLTAPGVT